MGQDMFMFLVMNHTLPIEEPFEDSPYMRLKNIDPVLTSTIQAIGGGEEGGGVKKLAITGRTWAVVRQHFPELIPRVLLRTVVWARMSPDQKAQLVEALQVEGVNWSKLIRGAFNNNKNGKTWSFGPTRGGRGLTESQLFVKFFQNQICLGTVHKCDETHTTQMGRQYLINS